MKQKDLDENPVKNFFRFFGLNSYHIFGVQVYLDDLDPEAVRVKLYADGTDGGAPEPVEMQRAGQPANGKSRYTYRAGVPTARPATDYTARLIPHHDGVAIPLEAAHILWQR